MIRSGRPFRRPGALGLARPFNVTDGYGAAGSYGTLRSWLGLLWDWNSISRRMYQDVVGMSSEMWGKGTRGCVVS